MSVLSPKFQEAMSYAADLHATQRRKSTKIPYVAHLLAVASLVLEHGGTEAEAIGGLLHDAIEDQSNKGQTRRQIRERFGPEVLAIVEGCTDGEAEPGKERAPWKPRKEAYIAHLASASASTRLVSVSDKLHNARAILADLRVHGDALWSRFTGDKDGSLWYYRELVIAFRKAGGSESMTQLIDELDRTVTAIERLAGEGRA